MAIHCVICSAQMGRDILPDTYRCASCGFYSSMFSAEINANKQIDEAARARALRAIRLASFNRLLNDCASLIRPGGTILDVGCAHGWFLSAANNKGFVCTGIDPDEEMALHARREGHNVIVGFFPDAIAIDQRFNAIAFNDVFEHLPDLNGVLNAVRTHLQTDGLVIINLPVSSGLIFRLARVAAKIGVKTPLARLWQQGLPSPHLSYFNTTNLKALLDQHGFTQEACRPLKAFAITGLYERITYDKGLSRPKALIYYCLAIAIALVASWAPADTRYIIFRKRAHGDARSLQ
jgi:SAM-dependent methyltransferase